MSQFITDISQRSSAEVTIKRGSSTIKNVLITPRSIRRYTLMQEDYIQLEFSLVTPVRFAIGDYVDDEVFGRFYVTEEQMPKYNTKTGGYDYSLRFDAPYMRWRNWLHCMVADVNGTRKRMESSWNLTDKLLTHAQQIAENVNLIITPTESREIYDRVTGKYTKTSSALIVDVSTATKAGEVHHIPYDGMYIIDALNKIAEEWECEWWVTTDEQVEVNTSGNHYVIYSNVLHFGKCEYGQTAYEMTLNDNVESLDVARDQQTFANRIFAYGGTQNIPGDYDRHLTFLVDDAAGSGQSLMIRDTHRKLKFAMLNDVVDGQSIYTTNSVDIWDYSIDGLSGSIFPSGGAATDTYKVKGTLELTLENNGAGTLQRVFFEVAIGNETMTKQVSPVGNVWLARFPINVAATESLTFSASVKYISAQVIDESKLDFLIDPDDLEARGTGATAARNIEIVSGGVTYKAVLNPFNAAEISTWASYIGNIRLEQNGQTTYPSEITEFTIPEKWLNLINIPYSYFTADYDGGVLSKVGDRRIHLPSSYPNRCLEAAGVTADSVVELSVIFEDIFPKLALKVASIETEVKTDDVEMEDGSIRRDNWLEYRFTVVKEDDSEFVFDTRFIMDGCKLEACFTSPSSAQTSGYQLQGMRFEVGFDNATQIFTLIRNESYGAPIPNSVIYPQVGDTLFLAGWNPNAMNDLGIVEDAEEELEDVALAYLQAIQAGQFTLTAKMMSKTMMRYPFCSSRTRFGLLGAGAKVTVIHAALPGGAKTSRVIGYEYKLDMPYDTPTYVIGETDAFSRIKQIEKKLTKLT